MKSVTIKEVVIIRRPVKLKTSNRTYKECLVHGKCIHRLKNVDEPSARFRWFCEICDGRT